MLIQSPSPKLEAARLQIEKDVEAFIKKGGAIRHFDTTCRLLDQVSLNDVVTAPMVLAHVNRSRRARIEWTEEKLNLLREQWGKVPSDVLAYRCGCSKTTVCSKASEMGLTGRQGKAS